MLTQTQRNHIADRVKEITQLAEQKYGRSFPRIRVRFKKQGRAAGAANWSDRSVNFNAIIAADNFDKFDLTIGHEVAHIIARDVHGPQAWNHGPLWKRTMTMLGFSPKRCHDYDITNAARHRAPYLWKCACTTHQMTGVRHNKLLASNGTAYRCKKCKHDLKEYVGRVGEVERVAQPC